MYFRGVDKLHHLENSTTSHILHQSNQLIQLQHGFFFPITTNTTDWPLFWVVVRALWMWSIENHSFLDLITVNGRDDRKSHSRIIQQFQTLIIITKHFKSTSYVQFDVSSISVWSMFTINIFQRKKNSIAWSNIVSACVLWDSCTKHNLHRLSLLQNCVVTMCCHSSSRSEWLYNRCMCLCLILSNIMYIMYISSDFFLLLSLSDLSS